MLLRRIFRPSTARRLGSWVLLGSFGVLAVSLVFVVQGAQSAVQKRTGDSLTALASATANALFDASGGGILSSTYLKRLTVGYSAAAAVVITLFPLLPALFRRLAGRRRPCRAHRPGT